MNYECLSFEEQGAIGILKINRPKALNALNQQLLKELDDFLESLKEKPLIRSLVITGEGEKAFVAGADIKEMEGHSSEEALIMSENGQRIFQKIEDLPLASIAAVNGFALGGGMELALSCDFIIASNKAKFGLPEVSLGLIPGYGGTQRLSRCIGPAKAKMVTLTGDIYTAQQVYEWGLAAKVVEPDQLLSTAIEMAQTIGGRGPVAVALAKRAIIQGGDVDLAHGMKLEAQLFSQAFTTHDQKEGIKAFIEKRKPEFVGR